MEPATLVISPFPLVISVALNVLGLLGGSYYLYRTRSSLIGWYRRRRAQGAGTVSAGARGYYRRRVDEFHALQEHAHGRKVIMLVGDSLTDELEWAEHLPPCGDALVVNRGIGGDTVDGLLERFDTTFSPRYNLCKIFLLIGINDMTRSDFHPDVFLRQYETLLAKLTARVPASRIYLHGMFPVRRADLSNALIRQLNVALRQSASRHGLGYIAVAEQLADASGQLAEPYTYDGIHLTFAGYQVWIEALKLSLRD